ncbi:MAG TPA: nitronate monooxygenase family protein [Methyloceanibacter sp.]|nr:nitronate monooxygenase family protein [Methyloceanibacter sp.]
MAWPDIRLIDLFGIELPIVQAPMANSTGIEMAIAVAEAGGLGSFPCATITPEQMREGAAAFRAATAKPLHVNFFCHEAEPPDPERDRAWIERLAPYFEELGTAPPALPLPTGHAPFGEADCAVVEALRPDIVSFHFGLPAEPLLARVKAAGCKVTSTATSVREAKNLAERGVDAIIAQGAEAGGHRGMFLETDVFSQVGTFALVRAIAGAVDVPVIAAGGIGDAPAIAAAFALGASAVQMGTAYLLCAEAYTPPLHRAALADPARATAITNILTGRPARGVVNRFMREQGPINAAAPVFPFGRPAIAPLRAKAEAQGSGDFSPLWSGQGPAPVAGLSAKDLTNRLASAAQELFTKRRL